MNIIIKILTVLTFFVAAIWGLLLGVITPITMLINYGDTIPDTFPTYVPILWLITSVVGFILPCFLLALKKRGLGIPFVIMGAISLFVVHNAMPKNGIAWLYLPLLTESITVILIFVISKLKSKKENDNKKSPSILGN